MKKGFFILCGLLALGHLAHANVARIYRDGSFSGNLHPAGNSDRLFLAREHLDIAFPVLESNMDSLQRRAFVTASYTVVNQADLPVQVPLQFLGLNVTNPQIMVNGLQVPCNLVEDPSARAEFLEKITRHRHGWEPKLYALYLQYLDAVDRGNNTTRSSSMISLDLDGFIAATRKVQSLDVLFPKTRHFSALAFTVTLTPGTNTLQIRYEQGLFLNGRTSYSGGPIVQAGFDYLLYPARSWTLGPAFELLLTARLPDLVKKGWLWDSRQPASWRSNMACSSHYDQKTHTTTLTGRYQMIPSDLCSIVIKTR